MVQICTGVLSSMSQMIFKLRLICTEVGKEEQ